MNAPSAPRREINVDFFCDDSGHKPAAKFIKELTDPTAAAAIRKKLYLVQRNGLSGGEKKLTGNAAGMNEFRLFSPPIRIFFIEKSSGIMVLGISDKDGQTREIQKCVERKEIFAQRANKKYQYQPPLPHHKFPGLKDHHS